MEHPEALAKITWRDPHSNELREYVLLEGATATIGRAASNDIQIAEQHVSRQHAVVSYRDGIFMINDLGSSNGTFVNDRRVTEPFPLFAGDRVRLYVPELLFLAATNDDYDLAEATGRLIVPPIDDGQAVLMVTNGPQEGQTIPLLLDELRIGRATSAADWEIVLRDPSVSRPHARLLREDKRWRIEDLGSSNGTFVNSGAIDEDGRLLVDGDTIALGASVLLFRTTKPAASTSSGTFVPD